MNVDLVLLKAEIEKEIRIIAQREEAFRAQLENLKSVVSFLEENEEIEKRCRVGADGDFTATRRPQSKNSGIRICPRCEVKVLPTKDGRCPSCQTEFSAK